MIVRTLCRRKKTLAGIEGGEPGEKLHGDDTRFGAVQRQKKRAQGAVFFQGNGAKIFNCVAGEGSEDLAGGAIVIAHGGIILRKGFGGWD